MRDLQKRRKELLKDPEALAEREASKPEMEVIRALIGARIEQNLTQEQLARRSGIRQSNISRIENGTCSPTISTLQQLASGMGAEVFTTGRGTPYSLAAAPVLKICSRSEVAAQWPDLIDINAGPVSSGERTIEEVGTELFLLLLDVVSGRKKSLAEEHGLANDLCIFNPAPIT